MTFREIISREEQNIDCIWLYKEGMFMKKWLSGYVYEYVDENLILCQSRKAFLFMFLIDVFI